MKLLIIALTVVLSVSHAYAKTYTFGIVPQQSVSKLARLWKPILKQVSKDSGVNIRFASAKSIPVFEKKLSSGSYDFSYMNPYHYVSFNKSQGYRAINKAADKRIKGIIVVAKNKNIDDLSQLADQKIAFPAPGAFAASILTQNEFKKSHVAFTPEYVSTHDNVYVNVARGKYLAGGGVNRTFKNMHSEIINQLKILKVTDGFTPHAIAVHPRVGLTEEQKIQEAFAKLISSPKGKKLLQQIKIKGFEKATDKDWDDVRGLGLKPL